ncbi:MAG: serine/threonine protein phosphatase [Planctomycetaceae bacterium]|nr:serine/threonine protein phosphatase [Planctomycetaceae bacterium]
MLRIVLTMLLSVTVSLITTRSQAKDPAVGPLPDGAFSFVVLPDTQGYVSKKNEPTFAAEIDWILENRKSQNIRFVSHVGDIVDDYKSDAEWTIARRQMMRLHGKVPFAFSVGNHDMLGDGESTRYQQAFPASLFENFDWYGGQIKNNANSFQLFEVEGYRFLWLHLECNAPDDVLAWANGVIEKHADRRVLATTHMYLGPAKKPKKAEDFFEAPKGRMRWHKRHGKRGNTPQQLWEKCFSRHKNLFLVCCGDQSRSQAMHSSTKGEQGNVVHECLSDYREGYLRIYRFLPTEKRIRVITYSPAKAQLCPGTKIAPEVGDHQFELEYDLSR